MNIVPKLNLNKHPKDVEDYSLVDATNMIINNNAPILQTDNSLVDVTCNIIYKDGREESRQIFYGIELLIGDITGDYELGNNTIKYVLPCNEELIIFVENSKEDEVDTFYIFRYNEKLNKLKLVADSFQYNGGKLIGTFTYNQDNLIIAISEYFEEDDKKIPLKVIDLGTFDKGVLKDNNNQLIYSELHSIVPQVIIPEVNTEYTYSTAYKGWYYIFIRYKHSTDNYTQWFNTNECIFIDNSKEVDVVKLFISSEMDNVERPGGSSTENEQGDIRYDYIATANLSDEKDIASISFRCNIKNLDARYISYQLGFICVSKTYTKCFKTIDINMSNLVFDFKHSNVEEYSVNEIISSYFNYYNVKSLTSCNNRLYIGNYLEDVLEKDIDISNITIDIKSNWVDFDTETIVEPIKHYYINAKVDDNIDNVTIKGEFSVNADFILDSSTNKEIIYFNSTYFYSLHDSGYKEYSIRRLLSRDNISLNVSYLDKSGNRKIRTILAKNFIFSPKVILRSSNRDDTTIKEYGTGKYYFINDDGSLDDVFNDGYYTHGYNEPPYYISIGLGSNPAEGRGSAGKIVNHKFDYYLNIEETNIEEQKSINYLIANGAMPDGYYNLFIHFVNEYGIPTKGFPLNDDTFTINIDSSSIVNKEQVNGKTLYKVDSSITANKYTNIEAKINKLPNSHIGWFISYEKFEKNIIYKGVCHVDSTASNEVYFYSDELNFADSIDFDFDTLVLFNDDSTITEYEILSKSLNVADSYNNILKSTNIKLGISTSLTMSTQHRCYLKKNNIDAIYNNQIKTLIPCSSISYTTYAFNKIKIKNSFISKSHALIAQEAFYNAALKVFQKMQSSDAIAEPYYQYESYDYFTVPFESLQLNNKPIITFFPDKGLDDTSKEADKTFVIGSVVEVKNTIDLYQQKQVSVDELYPKILDWYNPDIYFTDKFNKTIRRSNVIQDESLSVGWRKFEIEQYKNITENKGNIVKLISIGVYFLVHTEHSLFLFDATDRLKSTNGNIQLNDTDIWDIKYKEVITSDLGYGGVQKESHGIYGSFGYIFYDKSSNRLFRYDNSKLERIDNDINEFILKLKDNDVHFVDDKQRHRILMSFVIDDNEDVVLSYNYQYNVFVSHHSYYFEKGFSTKNNIYLLTKSKYKNETYVPVFVTFDNNAFGNYLSVGVGTPMESNSDVSIIVNTSYSLIKFIEYIKYKVNSVSKNSDINYSPVEGRDPYYAGDEISISSEFCNTGVIAIENKPKNNLNKVNDFTQPYWRFGNWHFNMIRNKITEWVEDIANKEDNVIKSDDMSRVYGNWFVIKFKFNSGTQKEIETLDCQFSLDKN